MLKHRDVIEIIPNNLSVSLVVCSFVNAPCNTIDKTASIWPKKEMSQIVRRNSVYVFSNAKIGIANRKVSAKNPNNIAVKKTTSDEFVFSKAICIIKQTIGT